MPKNILITGASRGIGRETARLFAQQGNRVAINYNKSKEKAESLARVLTQNGCEAIAVQADISSRTEVGQMVEKIVQKWGGIDVLVNNAGIAQQKLLQDITEEDWQRMFNINVTGAFFCTQAVLPFMLKKQAGCIINVSSIWGIAGASMECHYSASKAALIGLTKALAKELGPSGIRVNCVAPGVIDTQMNAALSKETLEWLKEETPLGILGRPEDIAQTICFLASPKAGFITGQVLSPNGGFVI